MPTDKPRNETMIAAVSTGLGQRLKALLEEIREVAEAAEITPQDQAAFMVSQLLSAAAQAAVGIGKINRETFEAIVKAVVAREFQAPVEVGLTTRQRGSA